MSDWSRRKENNKYHEPEVGLRPIYIYKPLGECQLYYVDRLNSDGLTSRRHPSLPGLTEPAPVTLLPEAARYTYSRCRLAFADQFIRILWVFIGRFSGK